MKPGEVELLLNDIKSLGYIDLRSFFVDAVTGMKMMEKLRQEYKNCIIIRNQDPINESNNRVLLTLQYLMEGINVA